jgi:ribosomal protein L40E
MENEELNSTTEVLEKEQNMENEIEQEVKQEEEKNFCIKCGAELAADQLFCPKCGHKVGEVVAGEAPASPAKKKNNIALIIGIIAAVVVLAIGGVVAFFIIRGKQAKSITLSIKELTITEGETQKLEFTIDPDDTKDKTVTWTSSDEAVATVDDKGKVTAVAEGNCQITVTSINGKTDICTVTVEKHIPDFKELYASYDSKDWCDIASDGSFMTVDTNPNDDPGDDVWAYIDAYLDANDFIEKVNIELGFTAALDEKMGKTSWSMGRQTQENDNYIVSWTYHPDKGLEVMYEVKSK